MKTADLNLLVHFDALMECRSVSRAAERLGISQPAMSAALSRMRRIFNDPLFARDNGVWAPTARAQELYASFVPLLDQWAEATQPSEEFDPRQSSRLFSVYATDYVPLVLLPKLAPGLGKDAPALKIRIFPAKPLHGLGMLETNHVELVAGHYPDPPATLRSRFLFEEKAVCVVRADHPCLGRRWDLDAYLRYGHIDLAAHTSHFSKSIDRALAGLNRTRVVSLTMSSYLAAPFVVADSDLIATLPLSVARTFAAHTHIAVLDAPLPLPALNISLYWHERHQRDAAHAWLRQYTASLFGPQALPPPCL